MHGFDTSNPIGGLDLDSVAQNVEDTDYVYALNVRNAINNAARGNSLTNIQGNVDITKYTLPYGSTSTLPNGQNKCIGAFEDTKYNTVIFCVWNSNGEHQILRYYRNKTSPANPYGEVQQIISYDFGWNKDTRITSGNIVYGDPQGTGAGDLFYWCDPVPKKINLDKANICEKYKSWNVYLPLSKAGSSYFFQVVVRRFDNNAPIASINVNIAPNLTIEQMFASLAQQINAGLGQYITADACDCKLTITEDAVNAYNIVFTNTDFYVVPENWYGLNLIDRFFDRCKWQPMNAPQGTYMQDVNFLPNYVKRKVFQFRLEYIYDDGEQSALGVWSQIPIDNLACNGTSNEALNYIDVDFNDTELTNATTLVLLKCVRFVARELNTGNDRAVIDLEPCEFLDLVNGNKVAHFKFYNNIISNAIDPVLAAKLFDNVPLEVNAEEFVKNRMIEGGIKEGYDAPECPKATYTIDFEQNPNPTLYRVKFKVRILTYGLGDAEQGSSGTGRNFNSAFPNYKKYPFWISSDPSTVYALNRGGIFHDTTRTDNNFPFFGGGGFGSGAGGDFGIRSGMETDFDQRIPEGGFPIYAAGTPYFGISRQISVDLPVDGVGALETSTQARRDAIGNYLYCNGGSCGDLYSEVEILLPAGEYVFRVASHWCSFGDVLNKGFMYDLSAGQNYQKTSTNVHGCFDPNGNWVKEKEIRITVNSDIPNGGTFLVMDLAPPHDFTVTDTGQPDIWQPINLYLFDSLGNSDINSDSFTGVAVEKAGAFYQALQGWYDGCTTDHNGYFFGITVLNSVSFLVIRALSGQNPNAPTLPITILTDSAVIYYGSLTDVFTKTTMPYNWNSNSTPPTGNGYSLVYGAVATDTPDARNMCSTFINGNVLNSNGDAVSGVLAVYENGKTGVTLQDGSYSIIAWADMVTANLAAFATNNTRLPAPNRLVDDLIFQLSVFCQPVYPNGQSINIDIDPFGPNPSQYNPTNPYIVADFIIDENNNPALKARKRGGQYIDGIRYYDNAGRLCSVARLFDIYIPFETEDLNKYFPNQYAPNTYIQGKPVISWALDPNYNPPEWAAFYQFVRTKNLIYGRYLQWVANQVTYLSAVETDNTPEIETAYANGDATAIKISISNIISYQSANNDSQVGYTFEQGDRLRLMADRTVQFYQGVNDFEITSYDETTQSVIVKITSASVQITSGCLLEIFNPKSVATDDEQILYEVGEVYKCTAPNTPNNQHSVTSGTFTNGDTYWRGRLIIVNDSETKFAAAYPVTIEDASVSDFYPSDAQDIGRIGLIDPNFKQIYRPMLMRFSNQFIPSTAVNGLSSFEELNAKELDRADGQIQRFIFTQNNLVVIGSRREVSNYIQRITAYQAASNTGVLSLSDSFLGTDYVHSQQLGTDLPASVCTQSGKIFGWTNYMANAWKYQGDGEVVISDAKVAAFFKQLSDEGITDAVAVYDRYHEEYILTYWRKRNQILLVSNSTPVSGGYDIRLIVTGNYPELYSTVEVQLLPNGKSYTGEVTSIDGAFIVVRVLTTDTIRLVPLSTVNLIYSLPETIVWFEGNDYTKGNKWISFRSYTPENYCALGDEVVSFKDGYLWIQDKSATRNNFFTAQYDTVFTPMFNAVPQTPKVWHSFNIKQYQANGGCDWSATMTNLNNQLSRINKANWRQLEEFWYTPCKRDLTDDSVPAQTRIVNGRMMRSSTLELRLANDYTGELFLNEVVARYQISERSTK